MAIDRIVRHQKKIEEKYWKSACDNILLMWRDGDMYEPIKPCLAIDRCVNIGGVFLKLGWSLWDRTDDFFVCTHMTNPLPML